MTPRTPSPLRLADRPNPVAFRPLPEHAGDTAAIVLQALGRAVTDWTTGRAGREAEHASARWDGACVAPGCAASGVCAHGREQPSRWVAPGPVGEPVTVEASPNAWRGVDGFRGPGAKVAAEVARSRPQDHAARRRQRNARRSRRAREQHGRTPSAPAFEVGHEVRRPR